MDITKVQESEKVAMLFSRGSGKAEMVRKKKEGTRGVQLKPK